MAKRLISPVWFTKRVPRPEICYLILALLGATGSAILTPPFQVPDEPNHFFRVYQLSEGTLLPERLGDQLGGSLPKGLKDAWTENGVALFEGKKTTFAAIREGLSRKRETEREFVSFPNSALYSPVPYLPQVAGVMLGRAVSDSVLVPFYLGRFFSAFVNISLIYFAILLIPAGKWAFAILGLAPLTLSLQGSQSADPVVISLGFLLTAFALNLQRESLPLTPKESGILLRLSALLGLCKFIYCLLPFALIPLLWDRLTDSRRRISFSAALAAACLLPNLIWSLALKGSYVQYRPGNFSVTGQLHHVLTSPLNYLGILWREWVRAPFRLITEGIGVLGWMDVRMPTWFYVLYFLAFVLAWRQAAPVALNRFRRAVLFTHFWGFVFLLCLTHYLIWNTVGSPFIEGVSGRYFLPLMPLAVLWLPPEGELPPWRVPLFFAAGIASVLALFQTVCARYYL